MCDMAQLSHVSLHTGAHVRRRMATEARAAMSHRGKGTPSEWARAPKTTELLQRLLSQPLSELLDVGDSLPLGGLCDAHIIEL